MNERQRRLELVRKRVDRMSDGLSMPVDEGIKECVVMLQALGIATTMSCEGHFPERAPWLPYVQICTVPQKRRNGGKWNYRNWHENPRMVRYVTARL